jgi:hypothetical protein
MWRFGEKCCPKVAVSCFNRPNLYHWSLIDFVCLCALNFSLDYPS